MTPTISQSLSVCIYLPTRLLVLVRVRRMSFEDRENIGILLRILGKLGVSQGTAFAARPSPRVRSYHFVKGLT